MSAPTTRRILSADGAGPYPAADMTATPERRPSASDRTGHDDSQSGRAREKRAVVPDHADTVLVPLANPDTAPELLTLAAAMTHGGRGRVIALVVVLGDADAESNLDRIDAVKQMADTVRARDGQVRMEVLTRPAISVARGILDATRDEGADLVLLGVQAPTPGGVAIGTVAEQVITTADCDVLIYRRGRHGQSLKDITGVVVGVDGSDDARVAARTGMILGQGFGKSVEALHVRTPAETLEEAALIMDGALHGLDGEERCTRRTVDAPTVAEGLRSHVEATRLVVVGFHTVNDLTRNRLGRNTRAVLDTMRGPVVAISRPDRPDGPVQTVTRYLRQLRPRLTDAEEQSLVWKARLDATLSTDFVVTCVVSAMLATFGLLLNSSAVIIGAMLVAPLMSPIVAVGTALVDGDLPTLRRAAATTGIGSVLVASTAFVIGLLLAPETPTSEMLSRGSPTLIDLGVAAASGVIGGYAGARKGIPAALAGVAIAAALVPPVCVFGLALSSDARLAAGSGLLFITNLVSIAAASAGVLLWLGVRLSRVGTRRNRYVRFTLPALVTVTVALVMFGLTAGTPDLAAIQAVVEDTMPGVEVVSVDIAGPAGTVTATIRSTDPIEPDTLRVAADRVRRDYRGLELRVAVQQIVEPGS